MEGEFRRQFDRLEASIKDIPRQLGDRRGQKASEQFDAWLLEALVKASTVERIDRLLHWTQAPAARLAHPREDHLLPLMVAVGAAQDEPATCVYHQRDLFGSITCSSCRFGAGQ
jgi:aromatic ring-opening dioxygenase catalytic subunit (LigB family)